MIAGIGSGMASITYIFQKHFGGPMNKKYFKNSLQHLAYLSCTILIDLLIIITFSTITGMTNASIKEMLWLVIGVSCPYILYLLIGFYWVFQKILIDEEGIHVYLFSHKITDYKWKDIEDAEVVYVKIGRYSFKKYNSNAYLRIDASKSIKNKIDMYAPQEVLDTLNKNFRNT